MNTSPRQILLILPRWPEHTLWSYFRYQFPALGLLTLAGATPPHYGVSLVDENIKPLDPDTDADLVAISLMTPLAPRGYALADAFRARGKTVVLGGIHASCLPDEAAAHADAVVIGEGEMVWPQLLADWEHGALRRVYPAGQPADLSAVPTPRRDLLAPGRYITASTIQLTRGCPYDCDYCSVSAFFGRRVRCRPLAGFLDEFRRLPDRFVFIVDDNLVAHRPTALALCEQLRGCGKWWGSQAPITVADDDELLRRMAAAGCKELFIGFESLDQANLQAIGKTFVDAGKNVERIRKIQDQGIGILGSFMAGLDHDDAGVFDALHAFITRTRLEAFLISVLTPFPGTRLTRRLETEGRILSRDWSRYDMNTVVFQPRRMTPDELQHRFNELHRELYRIPTLLRRTVKPRPHMLVFLPQNFGYRAAWRSLLRSTP